MRQEFLQVCNLARYFPLGDKVISVLKNTNMNIKKGETIALLGRSGCGKSTLLNLLAGIDIPDGGHIIIDNQNLGKMNEKKRTLFRRQHIGFIHQFFNLIPTLTAADNIALPLELNHHSRNQVKKRVAKILKDISLLDRADDFPDQLSGGEQQRIALARALVHQPKLILADEPTGNLDAQTGKQVLELLHRLVDEYACTLITVTHSMAVARSADRILTLEQGQLAERAGNFAW